MCRIYVRKDSDIYKREDWQSNYEWLKEKTEKIFKVFVPLIKNSKIL